MFRKIVKRNLSLFDFPWKFDNHSAENLDKVPDTLAKLLEDYKDGYSYSYSSILDAMADFDTNHLNEICSWKIYKSLEVSLNELKSKNQKVLIINKDEPIEMEFFDEKFDFSIPTLGIFEETEFLELYLKKFVEGVPENVIRKKNINFLKYEKFNEGFCRLSVNVRFHSKKKILIVDENNIVIEGKDDGKAEFHAFRFSIQKAFDEGIVPYAKKLWFFRKFLFFGTDFTDSQWIITNIDNHIE